MAVSATRLYTSLVIVCAIGTVQTSARMHPYLEQPPAYRACARHAIVISHSTAS